MAWISGGAMLLAAVVVGQVSVAWGLFAAVLAVASAGATLVGDGVETVVASGRMTVRVARFYRWSVDCASIAEVTPTISDNTAKWFGGWNQRTASPEIILATGNGPEQSVGIWAVRIRTASGKVHQVGTFHLHELLAAIEANGGPAAAELT